MYRFVNLRDGIWVDKFAGSGEFEVVLAGSKVMSMLKVAIEADDQWL
jgi:hypothetical protein